MRWPYLKIALQVIVLAIGFNAFAQSGQKCKSMADQAQAACNNATSAAQGTDAGIGAQQGAGNIQNNASKSCSPNTGADQNAMNNGAGNCANAQQQCAAVCNSLRSSAASQGMAEYQTWMKGNTECQAISVPTNELAKAGAANGAATPQCDNTKQSSAAPQMPTPPAASPSSTPDTAATTPTQTSLATPASTTTTAAIVPTSPADTGAPSSFTNPQNAATGLPGAITGTSTQFTPGTGITTSPMPASGSGGGGGGGSSGGGSGLGTTPSANTASVRLPEGLGTDNAGSTSKMETDGGGGGGGGGAPGAAEMSMDDALKAYLPGGKKDPTSRKIASVGGKDALASAHPDIASPYSNIFVQISNRMQIYCKLKEFIGCK
jgi:hypothetical protein